ncbi:MAG: DUF4476 domain-containing protein [Capnocytophaga sp.]|nr:DUF4476 domain-containing protein [Capnocytophaga sp.]
MKKLAFFGIFLSQFIFAQEAGKMGTLLKNEAKPSEINVQRMEWIDGNKELKPIDLQQHRNTQINYQWNVNFGYSEVFIRIPEVGFFTIELGNQQISNSNGKFRFFDVGAGRQPLSIYANGYLIYRTTIFAKNDTRVVLDFFTQYGLYELASYPIESQWYGVENWNDIWNNPYRNNRGFAQNEIFIQANVMPDDVFRNFISNLRQNYTFDDEKAIFIEQQMRTTAFTSQQIKELASAFSFDKAKLTMAKKLYPICVDKNNFFVVYQIFTFSSDKKQLMEYVRDYR